MTVIETLPGYDATAPLLTVDDLSVTFGSFEGQVAAVDAVSFSVHPGETLCIVGESGSGKSVTQMAVMGLLSSPPAQISGNALFRGIELIGASQSTLSAIRGTGMSMIFQDAISSLNPALKVGFQIAEVYCARTGADRASGRRHAIELMERVAIPSASQRVDDYPFQFSGGMCQRIMIAMALALNPKVLIADEPTTALDVTVQRQVMELLAALAKDAELALILITHDLGVAAEQADRVMVMYAGRAVETGPTGPVFANPCHPYTQALLASMPHMASVSDRLGIISGAPPILSQLPKGCAFLPRCQHAAPLCQNSRPQLGTSGPDRTSACLRLNELFKERPVNV
ncbi:MAG: ABC transporter ATP-binding protein [Stappiaceae bacterium]